MYETHLENYETHLEDYYETHLEGYAQLSAAFYIFGLNTRTGGDA